MERKRIVKATSAGRPRSEASHEAILRASIELTREIGYDALTMEGIAARAGVGKATIYRWWASKDALLAEALTPVMRAIPVPDTGTIKGDLLAATASTMRVYADPATKALLSGLVAAMARSPLVADAVRGGFVAARRDAIRVLLERAVARGELRKRLDYELALDLLNGPQFYRFLVTGGPIDDRLTRGLVDVFLRGFATS
jgi:AcrR family transcriptional regulator